MDEERGRVAMQRRRAVSKTLCVAIYTMKKWMLRHEFTRIDFI